MRSFIAFIILACAVNFSLAQNNKIETITIKTIIYCDHCLQCGSCGIKLKDSIHEKGGIKKVSVNPTENIILVSFNPSKTNPEKIRMAISEAGFDADNLKAAPKAYTMLDDCCKKK